MLDISILKEKLAESFEEIKTSAGQDIHLVIGKTGAGKSTTVNYLIEYPLKRVRGGKAGAIDDANPPPAEMGDSAEAVTFYPAPYSNPKHNNTYVDCPGFCDNRGEEERVCVSLSTESVVHKSKSVRSIIAVIDWHSLDTDRSEGFKEIANILGMLLKPTFDPSRSILFVFTKADLRDVDHDYLCEKINKVIKAETSKLEKAKSKLEKSKDGTSNMVRIGGSEAETLENEIDSTVKGLAILKLMQANKQHLVLIDVFDKGETRNTIVEKLGKMNPVPKEAFDFGKADSVRRCFQESMRQEIVRDLELIKRLQASPTEIAAYENELEKNGTQISDYQSQIADIDAGKAFKGEQDPTVISNRKRIADNKQALATKERELLAMQRKQEETRRNLWGLDVSDEIEFWSNSVHSKRSSEVGHAASRAIGGKNYHTARILVGELLSPIILPVAVIAGLAKRIDDNFEYRGAPFTRVKEEPVNGKVDRITYDPAGGIYEAQYNSGRGASGHCIVTIYGEKRNKPDNKTKIALLNTELQELDRKCDEWRIDMKQLGEANRDLQIVIEECLKGDKKNVKKLRQTLEERLRAAIERTEQLKQIIAEKKGALGELEKELELKLPFFAIIEELSKFVDFNSPDYPNVQQEFLSSYHALKNKVTPGTNNNVSPVSEENPALPTRPAAGRGVPVGNNSSSMYGKVPPKIPARSHNPESQFQPKNFQPH